LRTLLHPLFRLWVLWRQISRPRLQQNKAIKKPLELTSGFFVICYGAPWRKI
jgi:hypothetical protein